MHWLVALLLAEVPPVQLAAPDLNVVGLPADRGAFFAEHLAQQLNALGFSVVTSRQMGSVLGLERQKQLMGCAQGSESCFAELASALGTDAVIVGSIARLEGGWQVNIAIVSSKDGKSVAVLSSGAPSEAAVLDLMAREAPRMAEEAFPRLRPGHSFTAPMPGPRRYSWIPAAAGAALLACAVGLAWSAWTDSDRLRGTGVYASTTFGLAEAQAIAASGQARQTLGFLLGGVGAAALVTAGSLALFGGDRPAIIVFVPHAGGGLLVLTGAWP